LFGIGWSELLLVVLVGVVFIGPKEIPATVYTIAKFIRKIKSITKDVNNSVEAFMVENELHEVVNGKVFEEQLSKAEQLENKPKVKDEKND